MKFLSDPEPSFQQGWPGEKGCRLVQPVNPGRAEGQIGRGLDAQNGWLLRGLETRLRVYIKKASHDRAAVPLGRPGGGDIGERPGQIDIVAIAEGHDVPGAT